MITGDGSKGQLCQFFKNRSADFALVSVLLLEHLRQLLILLSPARLSMANPCPRTSFPFWHIREDTTSGRHKSQRKIQQDTDTA